MLPTMRVRRKSDGVECVINVEDFNEKDYAKLTTTTKKRATLKTDFGDPSKDVKEDPTVA